MEFKVKKVKRCQGLLKRSKHSHIYHGLVYKGSEKKKGEKRKKGELQFFSTFLCSYLFLFSDRLTHTHTHREREREREITSESKQER